MLIVRTVQNYGAGRMMYVRSGKNDGKLKCELYNDSMQSWKCYPIQKAQLIIADVPYNVGNNFYGSNPSWYRRFDSNG